MTSAFELLDGGIEGEHYISTKVHDLAKSALSFTISERHVRHAIESLWLPPDISKEERDRRLGWATEAVKQLAPLDEAEAMLAVQMVSAHTAAIECLRKATGTDHSEEASRDLGRAMRFIKLYGEQMKALNHHRGVYRQTVIRPVFAGTGFEKAKRRTKS